MNHCNCPYCKKGRPIEAMFMEVHRISRVGIADAFRRDVPNALPFRLAQLLRAQASGKTSLAIISASIEVCTRLIDFFYSFLIAPPALIAHYVFVLPRKRRMIRQLGESGRLSGAGFIAAVNFVPSPKTRKLLKKLVADQTAHIAEMEASGQFKAARWNWWCTWWMIIYNTLIHTVTHAAKAVRGKSAT